MATGRTHRWRVDQPAPPDNLAYQYNRKTRPPGSVIERPFPPDRQFGSGSLQAGFLTQMRGAKSAQPPPVERDQALPVPLSGRFVVDLALREGETVVHARVDLELALGT